MPETVKGLHRIPVAECEITATIELSKEKGVSALYCGGEKRVHTYLFDVEKWTMETARAWVKKREGKQSEAEGESPTLSISLPAAQRLADGKLSRITHMGDTSVLQKLEGMALAPVTIVCDGKVYAEVILSRPVCVGADIYTYEVKVIEVYDPPLLMNDETSTTAYYSATPYTTPVSETEVLEAYDPPLEVGTDDEESETVESETVEPGDSAECPVEEVTEMMPESPMTSSDSPEEPEAPSLESEAE